LLGLGSVVDDETVAVSVINVPPVTVTTTVKVVDAPAANGAPEGKFVYAHEIVPGVQVQPEVPEVGAAETKVVLAGNVSVNIALLAAPGPLFVTTTVYVIWPPTTTGLGVPELVTDRFAVPAAPTIVSTVAELFARFGSFVPEVAETVSVICVPVAAVPLTVTTTVKVAAPAAPDTTSGFVHVITPAVGAAGQVQLAAPAPETAMDTNAVLAGTASTIEALSASRGPLFVTVCV